MSAGKRDVLVLGLADSGKTTLLMQLFGRLEAGGGRLRQREAPRNLGRLQAGLARLNQGLPVEHTPIGDEFVQLLHARDTDGNALDLALPDYSGEDLRKLVAERRLPERWRQLAAESTHWVLLCRLSQQPQRPDVLSKPLGALAAEPWRDETSDPDQLPLDMWSVELLQMLQYGRAEVRPRRPLPKLTVALSCWDELDPERSDPGAAARERLALLDSYCRAQWPAGAYRVLGLSALGQPLDPKHPSDDFLDQGPEQMGWVVLPDGQRDPDLTLLAAVD